MSDLRRDLGRARDAAGGAALCLAVLLSFSGPAVAQTTGSGATVLENGPTINPQILANVRYADQFSGTDLGAQINAAVSSLGSAGGVVKIRSGTYTWSTQVTIDPRLVSIQGDGSPFVSISCTAALCLLLNEPTFSIGQGGSIGGFTLTGNNTSSQIGIEAGGVIGELYEDIVLAGFSGTSATALMFNNAAAGNGWMERTITRKLRFDNNSVGWMFEYNTANPVAVSFGYSNLEAQCDTVNSGQTCIKVASGWVYHSRIVIFGNVNTGGTLISVPGTATGGGQLWANSYQIFAEGTGTGLNVGSGGEFTGYGSIDLGGMAVSNANSASYAGVVRVVQGPTEVVNGDAGSLPNFLGTGNAATIFPVLVRDISTPVAGFGFLEGDNISSAYAAVYSGYINAFVVLGCPYNPPSMASCVSEARIDTAGNVHARGAFYANGSDYAESVHVVGPSAQYEPGDVLTIDPASESRFLRSETAYSTGVAGIYSTKPGVLGSSHAMDPPVPEEIPLAIHGMVPCKVSAENGPVSPGDLLVSAGTPGYAMKGTDRSRMLGAVIGKSLGNLERGTGVVNVLVTLQ